jgi:lysozyme family protein
MARNERQSNDDPREYWRGVPRARARMSNALRREYQDLFRRCMIRSNRLPNVDSIASSLKRNKRRYMAAARPLAIPWYVVGIIHNMEGAMNFGTHLHNGDPLTDRTKRVPRGRPRKGNPPFTWAASAADALTQHGFDRWSDWTIPGTLFKFEAYNGWGYRQYHPEVLSPYLWSFSHHYKKGKYASDGRFDADLVSKQCGAAVLLRRMLDQGMITLSREERESLHLPIPRSGDSTPRLRASHRRSGDALSSNFFR